MLAFATGIFVFFQNLTFTWVGENLTFAIRTRLFESILYKNVSWFDNKERAPGILTGVLSEDVTEINGLSTEIIAVYLEGIFGILIGLAIAFRFTWRIALISLGTAPLVILGGFMMSRTQFKGTGLGASEEENDAYKDANALLSDVIMNYRTIIGFGPKNVEALLNKYDKLLEYPNKQGIKGAHISGIWFGYSVLIRFWFIGFTFIVAAVLIWKKDLSPLN